MQVSIQNTQIDLPISASSVAPIVSFVLEGENRRTDEVSVHFVPEEEICRLHEEFFNDPSPTDCITLPIDTEESEDYNFLGEVFVCPKAALDFTQTSMPYEEVSLYLVHTLLHLLGYKDEEESDQKVMREKEAHYLGQLKEQNLLLRP